MEGSSLQTHSQRTCWANIPGPSSSGSLFISPSSVVKNPLFFEVFLQLHQVLEGSKRQLFEDTLWQYSMSIGCTIKLTTTGCFYLKVQLCVWVTSSFAYNKFIKLTYYFPTVKKKRRKQLSFLSTVKNNTFSSDHSHVVNTRRKECRKQLIQLKTILLLRMNRSSPSA